MGDVGSAAAYDEGIGMFVEEVLICIDVILVLLGAQQPLVELKIALLHHLCQPFQRDIGGNDGIHLVVLVV